MNYETGFARDRQELDFADSEVRARKRRRLWIVGAIVAALLVALAAYSYFSAPAKPAVAVKGGGNKQAASVSVIVPGRQTVERTIAATGNLAARREMPVGIAGEGGQVTRVLVDAGSWVGAGQVLATVDRQVQSQQVASLAAQIGVSEADARLAQANLDRGQALVARGFISKADIDRLTATRDSARARVGVARAQLAQQRASTARLDIRAPAAGLVLERRVEPGQIVSGGSGVLFRLAQGGEFELLARVGEADLAAMSVGQSATVTPVGGTQQFAGQIWQISPVIDPTTRQGTTRIALPYDRALRPGGFASARVVSGAATVPLLPESAVFNDTKGSYVMIVGAKNRVERRTVKIGNTNSQGVTIVEGLSGQEQVVQSAGAFINSGEVVIPTRVKAR